MVDMDGRVLGLVLSRSVSRDDIGYALISPEVAPHLQRAQAAASSVGTGPCLAG